MWKRDLRCFFSTTDINLWLTFEKLLISRGRAHTHIHIDCGNPAASGTCSTHIRKQCASHTSRLWRRAQCHLSAMPFHTRLTYSRQTYYTHTHTHTWPKCIAPHSARQIPSKKTDLYDRDAPKLDSSLSHARRFAVCDKNTHHPSLASDFNDLLDGRAALVWEVFPSTIVHRDSNMQ